MRVPAKQATENWTKCLHELKTVLDTHDIDRITKLSREIGLPDQWQKFLSTNNVIKKVDRYYRWNERIPISSKLIAKFREYQHIKNMGKYQPKTIIKRTYVQHQELGLIRRFWKWIY